MRQGLQLQIGQQLTLTPQLQQAIRLLQLSTIDLNQEVQEALDSNPMLDRQEESQDKSAQQDKLGEDKVDTAATDVILQQQDIPTDLPVDSAWDDVYQSMSYSKPALEADDRQMESLGVTGQSLQEYLLWQMRLTPFSETDHAIATAIIDAIDDDGFLSSELQDIQDSIGLDEPVELEEVEAVLHRIQQFDPPGVAARDLQETLLIQLKQIESHARRDIATTLINQHLDALGKREHKQIMRQLKLTEDDFQEVMVLIQSLNPRPGSVIAASDVSYIVPDVMVKKVGQRWSVELNPEVLPKLRIRPDYAGLVRRADNSSDNTYMKNQLQEARWLMKSLQSRNETLLKVAKCIVEHQQGFLELGDQAMKPLVLHKVAEQVEMHESTISRVTTQKFMHTPQGIFELKYFFSSHVATDGGGECSSTAIRAIIKQIIQSEDVKKPYSDNKLAKLLHQRGIQVARRTVAKYREAMTIPSSNERRSLIKS